MNGDQVVDDLVSQLSGPAHAERAATLHATLAAYDQPGLYSWWADDEGLAQLSASFGVRLPPLIYAGQAGATSIRSRAGRTATLRSRIGTNHLNGNISSSTFRRTLTATLFEPLHLRLAGPGRLAPDSNRIVSAWIRQHLSVVCAPFPNRASLAHVEDELLAQLYPPLNLMGQPPTNIRLRFRELRARLNVAGTPESKKGVQHGDP